MTEKDCIYALGHIAIHPATHTDIRGGKMPPDLVLLLPDPRDFEGFREATLVANEAYRIMDPHVANGMDRIYVQEIFTGKVRKYIQARYHPGHAVT